MRRSGSIVTFKTTMGQESKWFTKHKVKFNFFMPEYLCFLVSELQNLWPIITLNLRNYSYIYVCGNLVLEITISIVSKLLLQHKRFVPKFRIYWQKYGVIFKILLYFYGTISGLTTVWVCVMCVCVYVCVVCVCVWYLHCKHLLYQSKSSGYQH